MIFKMVHTISKFTIIPYVKTYIKEISGIENIPKKGPFIVAANHASYMDHLIISSIIIPIRNQKVRYLAKKEHFQSPHQWLWHKWVGAIPLDRQKKDTYALDTAIEFLKKGEIIGIYPEGTRTLDGKLQKGKTGVARLALEAKVPVLPIGLIGTFEILPKGNLIPKRKKAIVNIGKPMFFEKYYKSKDNPAVLREITNQIMKKIAELCKSKYNY